MRTLRRWKREWDRMSALEAGFTVYVAGWVVIISGLTVYEFFNSNFEGLF